MPTPQQGDRDIPAHIEDALAQHDRPLQAALEQADKADQQLADQTEHGAGG